MGLQYNSQEKAGVLIFSIEEERITHDHAAALKETIFLKIADGYSRIVLDLSRVKEIDSSGLGALLFAKRQADSSQGDLKLAAASESVENIIRIAQLSRVFDLHNSVEAAVEAFK